MKQIMELVGGLMLLFGGLSSLSTFGLQGMQGTQGITQATVQSIQAMQAGAEGGQVKEQINLETKNLEREEKDSKEYYDYKEEGGEELWEKMKVYYKDYRAGGGIDEQHN
jgi:hypothetical protein